MDKIAELLQLPIWAVVGATDNQEKFGFKIYKVMKEAGFTVFPINPGLSQVQGDQCYPSLRELPTKADVVNFVIPPKIGENVVRDCASLGIKHIWLQPGTDSTELIQLAQQLNLNVVHHACVMVEIRQRGVRI